MYFGVKNLIVQNKKEIIMSGWTYITKTPRYTIHADYAEYKKLCADVKTAARKFKLAKKKLSGHDAGCVTTYACMVPDFKYDNIIFARIGHGNCMRFNCEKPCDTYVCPYYQNNVRYFEAKHVYRALVKQRKIYWAQKFANCR